MEHGFSTVRCVEGGEERTDSVQCGLDALAATDGFVAIHDAARPLATASLLKELLAAAQAHGGAVPAHRVVDTLMRTDDARVAQEAISRKNAWAVSTPQVFDLPGLRAAYASLHGKIYTDDAQVFMASGGKVVIVEEKSPNGKVTYPADIKDMENDS